MLKHLGWMVAVVLVLFSLGTFRQGVQDGIQSITRWRYYEFRDMRRSVVVVPNHTVVRGPDAESVPVGGKDVTWGLEGIDLATRLGGSLTNPVAADDSSIARGMRKFTKTCIPCHGVNMDGTGPVAQAFMPPPDLLAAPTRARQDGYIFSYIRHGGAVMPSYGPQVTVQEAWDLVNYVRHMQKTNPR